MTAETGSGRRIKTAETVFTIIELVDDGPGVTLTELANQMSQSKSTIYHYLVTLHELGYLVREDNEYYLGLRFLDHGMSAKGRQNLTGHLDPSVKNLADETGETAWVAVAERGYSFILDVESGDKAVHTGEHIGLQQYLHCHAAGKCILAHMPDERVEEIIEERGLPARTDRTITDKEELYAELETVREDGVAYMKSETIKGLNSVGAPIISQGEVLGAISVSGPAKRVDDENLRTTLADRVQAAANAIELEVTYS